MFRTAFSTLRTRYKSRLSVATKHKIMRALRLATSVLPVAASLDMLAVAHRTDKWKHGYIPHYQTHFAPLRWKPLNLLEIGVGGYANPGAGGGSLRMWKAYFPKAKIYGLDIHDKRAHEEKRIKIFQGSQNDPDFLRRVVSEIGRLDIIIDDGSHINEHVMTSFRTLFPLMPIGGIYVIEDLATAFYPQYGGHWKENGHKTSLTMLKELIHSLHWQFIPEQGADTIGSSLGSIHFYRQQVFICKAVNEAEMFGDQLETIEKARRLG